MAAFQADDGYEEPHVIAEIGCNHMGQFEIAKELLTLAKNAGATVGCTKPSAPAKHRVPKTPKAARLRPLPEDPKRRRRAPIASKSQ